MYRVFLMFCADLNNYLLNELLFLQNLVFDIVVIFINVVEIFFHTITLEPLWYTQVESRSKVKVQGGNATLSLARESRQIRKAVNIYLKKYINKKQIIFDAENQNN